MVVGRARCRAASVGHCVRKSQACTDTRSPTHSSACGKYRFKAGEPVGQRHALIHQFPALFAERLQLATLDGVGDPRAQCVAVPDHQVQQEFGIERVILRAAGAEGLAVPCQRLGINRVEHETVVHQQRVDHRALPLLERHGDFPAGKALLELRDPLMQHGRLLLELELLDRPVGALQMHRMPLVRPIQPDTRDDCVHLATPPFCPAPARLALVLRTPYSGVLSGATTRTTSEYAMSDQRASSPLDRPSQTVAAVGEVES